VGDLDPAAGAEGWFEPVRSLLQAPSPAVLTTYRQDGSALVTPVWFRFADGAFEVMIAEGDVKLRHLRRDPRCALLVFEAVRPFRGIEARGVAELIEGDVTRRGRPSRGGTSERPTDDASPRRPNRPSCSG
jgi:PPOX class probable F420-dependent enzyme